MIDGDEPTTWRDLQDSCARILREAGVEAAVERPVTTARGVVNVDVWAHDSAATPPQTYFLECKRWRSRVKKTVVHAFRTVVGDAGANWGAIISARGFQSGALEAAKYSNVRLLTWLEFQTLFSERWFQRHFLPTLAEAADPLVEYGEPINSRIFRKADGLPADKRARFRELREKHLGLWSFCIGYLAQASPFISQPRNLFEPAETVVPSLPLRPALTGALDTGALSLSDAILDAGALRVLLEATLSEVSSAVAGFDAVFGERA